MAVIYNLGIGLYNMALHLVAPFHKKAASMVAGRRSQVTEWKSQPSPSSAVWFHFASLGEFEQGKPVLQKFREDFSTAFILVTFFSPSGYNARHSTSLANKVLYLPADTEANAAAFVKWLNPAVAIFTKYEYWFNYFRALHRKNCPIIVISSHFVQESVFFRPWGRLHRQMLKMVSHFFVQNLSSQALLRGLGITNVTVAGDTRADAVLANTLTPFYDTCLEQFCAAGNVIVAGSTWPEDEKLLATLSGKRLVIAPHEVNPASIARLQKQFPKSALLLAGAAPPWANVLIIDSVGILAYAYRYAKVAYIGGGFGSGIHNTLEPAAYGVPVIFGPKYSRFAEATELIRVGAALSIKNAGQLTQAVSKFLASPEAGIKAKAYVQSATGATDIITSYLTSVYRNRIRKV